MNIHFIEFLNKNQTVAMIRDTDTGKLYVQRKIDTARHDVYEILCRSQLPHIPCIRRIENCANGNIFVTEDYIEGISLKEILDRRIVLTEKEAVDYMTQLCEALAAAHELGLVHRDIKPGNIMIDLQNRLWLVDFDIARQYRAEAASDTELLGTQGYAAPEQFGFGQSSERSDIYAAGVLLNVMLTGKMPQEKLPAGRMAGIVQRCTAIDPQDRYLSADDLKRAVNPPAHESGRKKSRINFIRRVPGFRSGKVWKILIALVFYFFAIMFCYTAVSTSLGNTTNMGTAIGFIIFFTGTYLFLFDIGSLRTRTRMVEKHRGSSVYVLFCAFWILLLFSLVFVMAFLFSFF
jgi:serine/threonine protein kinase